MKLQQQLQSAHQSTVLWNDNKDSNTPRLQDKQYELPSH